MPPSFQTSKQNVGSQLQPHILQLNPQWGLFQYFDHTKWYFLDLHHILSVRLPKLLQYRHINFFLRVFPLMLHTQNSHNCKIKKWRLCIILNIYSDRMAEKIFLAEYTCVIFENKWPQNRNLKLLEKKKKTEILLLSYTLKNQVFVLYDSFSNFSITAV